MWLTLYMAAILVVLTVGGTEEQKIFKTLLRKKVCVFQTQSIYYRPYRAQAGAQAPRPTRLSVKSSPCRRYWPRASAHGTSELATTAASRRHKDKFDGSASRRRARLHLNNAGIRRLRGCAVAQPYFPQAWSALRVYCARGYATTSPLRGCEKEVDQIRQINQISYCKGCRAARSRGRLKACATILCPFVLLPFVL